MLVCRKCGTILVGQYLLEQNIIVVGTEYQDYGLSDQVEICKDIQLQYSILINRTGKKDMGLLKERVNKLGKCIRLKSSWLIKQSTCLHYTHVSFSTVMM